VTGVILDSSCWIEILTDGKRATQCEKLVKKATTIYVPTLVLFEVYKKITATLGEAQSLFAVSYISENTLLNLDRAAALLAGDRSLEHGLAMADSIVLAHSRI
jgi:predicted nucleic acid-binding protein